MALTIAPAEGQQTATNNPQSVPTQTIGAAARTGGVQPGTATSLLTSQQGESLGSPALTTVSLGANPAQVQTQTQAAAEPAAKPAHHANAALISVPVILVLVAAGMFWAMTRSAKSTTN